MITVKLNREEQAYLLKLLDDKSHENKAALLYSKILRGGLERATKRISKKNTP